MKTAEQILKEMTLEQKIAQLQCTMALGSSIVPGQCPDGVGEAAILPVFMDKEQLADAIGESVSGVAKQANGVPPYGSFHCGSNGFSFGNRAGSDL